MARQTEIKDFAEKCERLDDESLAALLIMARALEVRQVVAESQKKNTA